MHNSTLMHPIELRYKNYHEKYFIGIKHLANDDYLKNLNLLWKYDDGMYRLDTKRI